MHQTSVRCRPARSDVSCSASRVKVDDRRLALQWECEAHFVLSTQVCSLTVHAKTVGGHHPQPSTNIMTKSEQKCHHYAKVVPRIRRSEQILRSSEGTERT